LAPLPATVAKVPPPSSATLRQRAQRYSEAQRRTIDAALELFADYGVGGTSLQMIADAVGVTKAAIYHQFRTREAIAVGVLEVALAQIEEAVGEAEAAAGNPQARQVLLSRLVDLAVQRRRAISTMQNDPLLVRFLNGDEQSRTLWGRLFEVLVGRDLDVPGRVRAAVLSAAIGSVAHPYVIDLDDDTLRTHLLELTRRFLDL
jgi:AcrR family transcriptional regulator